MDRSADVENTSGSFLFFLKYYSIQINSVKKIFLIGFIFVFYISFTIYTDAKQLPSEFSQIGESVQSVIKNQNISLYIDGTIKSIFTKKDTYSIISQQNIFNEHGNFLYHFYKNKLIEYSVQIKSKNIDSCYLKIISLLSKKYAIYSGDLFKNIETKFIYNNTLILLIKDKYIFIYFIDIEMYKESYS